MRKLLFLALCLCCLPAIADDKPELWLYYATNLQVDKNIDHAREIWGRAAAAGYPQVMITDSKMAKLGDLGDMTKTYFANIDRARKLAADLKLEIVPAKYVFVMSPRSPSLAIFESVIITWVYPAAAA